MDHKQQTAISWILFGTFWVLYTIAATGTLLMLFFGVGAVRDSERPVLIGAFLVETSSAIVALFFAVFKLKRSKEDARPNVKEPGSSAVRKDSEPAPSFSVTRLPEFRLRANGFNGGDDAALETVYEALTIGEANPPETDCFSLTLPEMADNLTRIEQLKRLDRRNDQEQHELRGRLSSHAKNQQVLKTLTKAFRVVLQDSVFRRSAKIEKAEDTWEVLVNLRVQLFQQVEGNATLHVHNVRTSRLCGTILLTAEEFDSEDTRYLNENWSVQGILVGKSYSLDCFGDGFLNRRCFPAIALLLSRMDGVPREASDISTWRISREPLTA